MPSVSRREHRVSTTLSNEPTKTLGWSRSQFGGDPGRRRQVGQGGFGIVGDLREIRRALDVQTTEALAGGVTHEADPTLGDRLRIKTVGVARHERHTGNADDVGFAAGQRQDALSAPADHDRGVWALHRAGPSGVTVHLNELARPVQLFALPVRFDE